MEGGHQKMIKIQMPVYLEDDFKKVPKYFSTFANLLMPLKIQILFYAQIKKKFFSQHWRLWPETSFEKCIK